MEFGYQRGRLAGPLVIAVAMIVWAGWLIRADPPLIDPRWESAAATVLVAGGVLIAWWCWFLGRRLRWVLKLTPTHIYHRGVVRDARQSWEEVARNLELIRELNRRIPCLVADPAMAAFAGTLEGRNGFTSDAGDIQDAAILRRAVEFYVAHPDLRTELAHPVAAAERRIALGSSGPRSPVR